MKKLLKTLTLTITICTLILASATPAFAAGSGVETFDDVPDISGTSAILIDGGSGEILYEKNAYEKRDPASVTKILNALVVLDNLKMKEKVCVSGGLETLGHVLELKQGEVLSVKDLMYGMLVYSGNDAAEALAIATGGSIDAFCTMMNQKAVECGAENTNFTNANGMNNPGQEKHRTTAYDLAMISRQAMKNKTFRKIVSTTKYTIPATNMSDERVIKSTNACLYKKPLKMDGHKLDFTYKGCTGIKTGETSTAGECIVCSAKRGDTELIAVILNAPAKEKKFEDARNLLDYGFRHYKSFKAQAASEYLYELKVKGGNLAEVDLGIDEDLDLTVPKKYKAAENVTVEEQLNADKVEAPIKKGTVLGQLVALDENGKVLASKDLVAREDVKVGGPLSKIGIADEELPVFIIITSLIVIALLIFIILVIIRRRNIKKRRAAKRRRMMQEQAKRAQQGYPAYPTYTDYPGYPGYQNREKPAEEDPKKRKSRKRRRRRRNRKTDV